MIVVIYGHYSLPLKRGQKWPIYVPRGHPRSHLGHFWASKGYLWATFRLNSEKFQNFSFEAKFAIFLMKN